MTNDSTATATATVYDYETGDALDGAPTAELVRESLAAGDTGAVAAYCEAGVWHHVPDCREDFYRSHRGCDVRTVYVDDYEPEVTVDVDSVEVYEGDAESDDDADDSDALSYYVSVDVTVDGERVTVGVMVGAYEADHGSIRAAGCGVRPYCHAWWADASDWQEVPEAARDAVLAALEERSWALFLRASEEVGADRPSC